MRLRTILFGTAIVAFIGGAFAFGFMLSSPSGGSRPTLAKVPPLPPVSRTSVVVAPAEITLTAIRDALEANAPRNLSGKRDNPVSKLLSNADIGWTVTRGPLGAYGKPGALAVNTAINGTLRVTGQLSNTAAGGIGGAIGGILGKDLGKSVEKLAGRTLDQRADIRGVVTVVSQPRITTAWRLEPNLTSQVAINDASTTIVGIKLSASSEVKPFLERQVNEQVAQLQSRLRNDPFLELAARREWAKLCRSLSIGAAGAGLPNLWLELRPTRAVAAQPQIDNEAVTLLLGVEAETRIVASETKPECPFPSQLELIPPGQGQVSIAVPIDVPFTEVNRLVEAQFAGKTFPEDKGGGLEVMVRKANVAASGNQLLISLRVKATERRSWFGLGTEATVHVWGRPVLDRDSQVLRLADVALDLESEGLLGAAARAAAPYLESALAERTVIDLKPFAANARKSIEAVIAEFRGAGDGVRVDAAVTDLRIVDIAFDSNTLRLVAEADGAAKVSVTQLPR